MSGIKEIYYKYIKKYMKYIPIIGIIVLIIMYSQKTNIKAPVSKNTESLVQQIQNYIIEFANSFDFSDKNYSGL